jgi:DNA polymerase I
MTHTIAVDVETTVRCPIGNTKANPHWPPNELVCVGMTTPTKRTVETAIVDTPPFPSKPQLPVPDTLLIGCHMAFDMQWLRRAGMEHMHTLTIWDVALAEYVLTGQEAKMISLDSLATKYGLPLKDDKIKAFWDAGKDTTDIPIDMLKEYCAQDVVNTHSIYEKQVEQAFKTGTFNLIMVLNGALLATIEMMWNGMKVDRATLGRLRGEIQVAAIEAEKELLSYVGPVPFPFNVGSNQQLSAYLFGGEVKYAAKELVGKYKTGPHAGEDKYRNAVKVHTFKGRYLPEGCGAKKLASGYYSTDDETLAKLVKAGADTGVEELLKFRALNKQLNTYFEPIQNLLFPGDFIYHTINATLTKTGRYSSSNPNLQNVTVTETKDGIKSCFTSRFGKDGSIVEADFKQLELVALAILSNDKQLKEDILDNVDIHTELYKQVYGKAPTSEQRRQFKRAVFAAVYGAGAHRIVELAGIAPDAAKRFITRFAERYPDVIKYREKTRARVETFRQPSARKGEITGLPLGVSQIQQPTGRILTFYEYEPTQPWQRGKASFSHNDICNYPIQSFATGDLVPLYLDKLYRRLGGIELFKGKAVLVNTVHDSVVLDCRNEVVEQVKEVLKNVAADMPKYVKEAFGMSMDVPLTIEVSHGPNWAKQEDE